MYTRKARVGHKEVPALMFVTIRDYDKGSFSRTPKVSHRGGQKP